MFGKDALPGASPAAGRRPAARQRGVARAGVVALVSGIVAGALLLAGPAWARAASVAGHRATTTDGAGRAAGTAGQCVRRVEHRPAGRRRG